jgi:hypothetical protein
MVCLRVRAETGDLRQRRLHARLSFGLPRRFPHRCASLHAGRASHPGSPERLEHGTPWNPTPLIVALPMPIPA